MTTSAGENAASDALESAMPNGLTDAQCDALQTLAQIAIGSLPATIERHGANALLGYMSSLERQRSALRAEAAALLARIGELEANAARYRWLRDNSHDKVDVSWPDENEDGSTDCHYSHSGADLDRAIDAAIAQEPPK